MDTTTPLTECSHTNDTDQTSIQPTCLERINDVGVKPLLLKTESIVIEEGTHSSSEISSDRSNMVPTYDSENDPPNEWALSDTKYQSLHTKNELFDATPSEQTETPMPYDTQENVSSNTELPIHANQSTTPSIESPYEYPSVDSHHFTSNDHEPRYIICGIDTVMEPERSNDNEISICRDIIFAHAHINTNDLPPRYMDDIDFAICLNTLKLTHNRKAVQSMPGTMPLPNEVSFILAFGPKFSLPIPFNPKRADVLLDAIRNLNSFHMSVYERRTITAMAREHMKSANVKSVKFDNDLQFFIVHCYNCTIKFFSDEHDHMVAMADKGNVSLVILRQDYISKVEEHLADRTTYTPIKTSSHIGYMKRNEILLKKLVDLDVIKRNAVPGIISSETKIPNMYGLIKTHKENQPIRPVVNTRSGPGYTLAAVLTKIFSSAQESHRFNVRNSVDVSERLALITPDPDEYLATLDIKNMFTNVSTEQAIISVAKRYHEAKIRTVIPLETLIEIIRFVTCFSTEVQFNRKTYKQIRGLKMGSSLSQVLSDFVVEDIIDGVFIRIERPKLFVKYVDDCAILARRQHIVEITNSLNDANESLQFILTMEDENGTIAYLDMQVINNHSFGLSTRWKQKPMASGRFLNFYSSHPRSTIMNTAKCFVHNMYKLTHPTLNRNLDKVADNLLELNNFPITLRTNIIRDAVQKWQHGMSIKEMQGDMVLLIDSDPFQVSSMHTDERAMYVTLPFFPTATPAIRNIISHVNPSIKTIGIPMDTLKKTYDAHKNLRPSEKAKKRRISYE